jgi:hypothetical protein
LRRAVAILALIPAAALADPRLAGTYDGIIQSTGPDSPGTTVLTVSDRGVIGGTYRYMDGPTPAEGKLRGCVLDGVLLTCLWFDAYGSGSLVVAFDPDLRSFAGSWYHSSQPGPHDAVQGGQIWTGRRQ